MLLGGIWWWYGVEPLHLAIVMSDMTIAATQKKMGTNIYIYKGVVGGWGFRRG